MSKTVFVTDLEEVLFERGRTAGFAYTKENLHKEEEVTEYILKSEYDKIKKMLVDITKEQSYPDFEDNVGRARAYIQSGKAE